MNNKEYADALREIAQFYEDNPTFVQASKIFEIFGVSGKEDFVKAAKMLGKCKKVYVDSMAHLDRDFGGIVLRVVEFRVNVCTKTVVGRKKVIRKVPVGYEEREVEEDIVEWDCGESLLKRAKEHAKEKFND